MENKSDKVKNYKFISLYLLPYKWKILGVIIALLFTSGTVLSLGQGIKLMIDKGFSGNNPEFLDYALFVLILLSLLLAKATYWRSLLTNTLCEQVVSDIRRDCFSNIIYLSPEFYEVHKTSDVISRLTNDTTMITTIISTIMSSTVRNIILFIGGFILLMMTSIKLTLYILFLIPLVVGVIILIGKSVRNLSRIALEKIALIGHRIEESINGIFTVQSFGREGYEIKMFNSAVEESFKASKRRISARSKLAAIVISSIFGCISFVMWIGGHDVVSGNISGGELSSFIFYAIVVASSLGAISEAIGDLQRANSGIERIIEVLNYKSKIEESSNAKEINIEEFNQISISNLKFSYPANKDNIIINDINFEINRGENIALVGSSGSGKTTIMNILLRLYDIDSGILSINGHNIKDLTIKNLRDHFSVVPQDTIIFSASIYDNILYGNPDSTEEEVMQAAKMAEVLEFALKLPDGINSFVGERGIRLSGGQKQRISIARAFLKDSPIMMLDEATSNLDTENESIIQEARLTHNKTTITIAHRLSTIQNADKIIVLNSGSIEAIGAHEDLLAQSPTYQKLYSYA